MWTWPVEPVIRFYMLYKTRNKESGDNVNSQFKSIYNSEQQSKYGGWTYVHIKLQRYFISVLHSLEGK
jgi:methionyl-tRNA synthetase